MCGWCGVNNSSDLPEVIDVELDGYTVVAILDNFTAREGGQVIGDRTAAIRAHAQQLAPVGENVAKATGHEL